MPSIPILGFATAPDASNKVYFNRIDQELTLGTSPLGPLQVCVIEAPTGADIGIETKFRIPADYGSAPKLTITGIITEAANTLAFGCKQLQRAASDIVDAALEAEDLVNKASWTGFVAEDLLELEIVLTPASAYVVGNEVFLQFYRDDSVDTQTGDFLVTGLYFTYTAA